MRALGLCALLAFAGCTSSVDPDKGRFACSAATDCGAGYECIKQAAGGGKCFKLGACTPEECNGQDDNCDGQIDETFATMNMACNTQQPGPCATGKNKCQAGAVVCVPDVMPTAELCDGVDNDCNGKVDDPFNFATDNANCGVCKNACASGTSCQTGVCRESNCSDGLDNDHDGGADCLDPACFARSCLAGFDGGFLCGLPPIDAGVPDAGIPDAGDPDAGAADAGDLDGGLADAGDLDAGAADAGPPDAGVVDAGPPLPTQCYGPEDCANGADDDNDGLTDCADPDCNGKTCASGTTCTNGFCPGPG